MSEPIQTKRSIQIVFWPDPREWAFGPWRWPVSKESREAAKSWPGMFGFYGFALGPVEFRYWPAAPQNETGKNVEDLTPSTLHRLSNTDTPSQ